MRRIFAACAFFMSIFVLMIHTKKVFPIYSLAVFILSLASFTLTAQEYKPIQTGSRITYDAIFSKKGMTILPDSLGMDSRSVSLNKNASDVGLGMFMQFNIKDYLFFRPEAIVHLSNRGMMLQDLATNENEELNYRLYSFSLPIQFGYRIDGFSLQTGIVWHSQLRTDLLKSDKENFLYEFGSSYTTFTVGLGYQSKWLLLDVYYETALGDSENTIRLSHGNYDIPSRFKHLSVRLGFIISGRN
jgi:hypothetical protein